jgi:hypothetical protein
MLWDISMQKTRSRSISSPCTRINSKWIKDLKISGLRPETLKLMQEIARNKLEIIVIDTDFLNRTQVAL